MQIITGVVQELIITGLVIYNIGQLIRYIASHIKQ